MVAQLGAEGALDQRLLEPTRGGFYIRRRERALPDDLVENVSRDRRLAPGSLPDLPDLPVSLKESPRSP
jgi:hypothetical protein